MRFIHLGTVTPEYSVAFDRAMFELHSSGSVGDTMCIYRRSAPSVSIGRYGSAEAEVRMDIAAEDGVRVVRRISGGSAIYSDPGQLTYSVVLGREHGRQGFGTLCGGVLNALRILGIEGEFKPVNDVLVDGRKISGSARYMDRRSMIQHGSLIVDTPSRDIERYLIRTKERTYDGTISLRDLVDVRIEDAVTALRDGFSEIFGHMTDDTGRFEDVLARELMEQPLNPPIR